MGQPGESHGLDPVRVDTAGGGAGDFAFGSSSASRFIKRGIVRAAAADQQFSGIGLSALQRLDDSQRSQLQQRGLDVFSSKRR